MRECSKQHRNLSPTSLDTDIWRYLVLFLGSSKNVSSTRKTLCIVTEQTEQTEQTESKQPNYRSC